MYKLQNLKPLVAESLGSILYTVGVELSWSKNMVFLRRKYA